MMKVVRSCVRKMVVFGLCGAVALLAGVAQAITTNLAVTAEMSPYSLVAKRDALKAVAKGNVLAAGEDVTIKLTPSGAANEVNTQFYAPGVTLTLDVTELDGADITFMGHLVAQKVIVKGRDSLRFWNSSYYDTVGAVNVQEMEFQDAEGNVIANPAGLTIGNALALSLPGNCPVTIVEQSTIALSGEAVLEKPNINGGALVAEEGVFSIKGFNLALLSMNAISPDKRIDVADGCTLTIHPRTINNSGANFYNWWGLSDSTGFLFSNTVKLNGSKAVFVHDQHYNSRTFGKFIGNGQVKFKPNNGKLSDNYQMYIAADFTDFTGPLTISATNNAVTVVNDCLAGKSVTLTGDTWVKFAPDPAAAAVSVGALVGDGTGTATVQVLADSPFAVGSVSGMIRFTGAKYDNSTVRIGAVKAGSSISQSSTVKVEFDEAVDRSGWIEFAYVKNLAWVCVDSSVREVDVSNIGLDPNVSYSLTNPNGHVIKNLPENVKCELAAGAELSLATARADLRLTGGAVRVAETQPWKEKALLWLDPSVRESCEQLVFEEYPKTYKSKGEYPLITRWNDVRPTQTEWYMENRRHFQDNPNKFYENVYSFLYPYENVEGMNFMSMADLPTGTSKRRIAMRQKEANKGMVAGTVVMVFGSQRGGGMALFANSKGLFGRTGDTLEDAITTNKTIEVWADGEKVDATTEKFSGGWQVIAVNTKKIEISGLGYMKSDYQDGGGQCYGEMLFFADELTDSERRAVEWYLAKKWGLSGNYKGAPSRFSVNAVGTGTITLESDAQLKGMFGGTVDLNGNTLMIGDEALPPTDADIPSEGRVAWIDPDYKGEVIGKSTPGATLVYPSKTFVDPCLVDQVFDRDYGHTEGKSILHSQASGRAPAVAVGARGFGPERTWIDFANWYAEFWGSNPLGRVLRLTQYPFEPGSDASRAVTAIPARTIFLVQDSVNGGGTPFLDTLTGSKLNCRLYAGDEADPSVPIWRSVGSKSDLLFGGTAGHTYLDGQEVNGGLHGFSGGPELLTATSSTEFPVGALGYYPYNDKITAYRPMGEIIGEVILYDRQLDETERGTVEAYLMNKWLGRLPMDCAYACNVNATITGAGEVTVANLAQLPKFQNFTGTLKLAPTDYTFTLHRDGRVDGAILADGGAVVFPASCAVNIVLDGKISGGDFVLVSGASETGCTDLRLDIPEAIRDRAEFVQKDGQLILHVEKPGALIFLR